MQRQVSSRGLLGFGNGQASAFGKLQNHAKNNLNQQPLTQRGPFINHYQDPQAMTIGLLNSAR